MASAPTAPAARPADQMEHQHQQNRPSQPHFRKLEQLDFDNLTLRVLPLDPVEDGPIRQVEGACFSRVNPTRLSNPQLVLASPEALALLDIDPAEVGSFWWGCVWLR
jgi:hypothetical protein